VKVGDLRKAIEGLNDDMPVVIDDAFLDQVQEAQHASVALSAHICGGDWADCLPLQAPADLIGEVVGNSGLVLETVLRIATEEVKQWEIEPKKEQEKQ
jgi:hypothetical protein